MNSLKAGVASRLGFHSDCSVRLEDGKTKSVLESTVLTSKEQDNPQLVRLLERMKVGDERATNELFQLLQQRLTLLAQKMLADFPGVGRWEQSEDILQNASLRLLTTLRDLQPSTEVDFFRLAALNIRRELIDLARRYFGPEGLGAHHHSDAADVETNHNQMMEGIQTTYDPGKLAHWTEFHQQIENLPEDEREIVDLLYYQGLTQMEAARLLEVDERTIRRRWRRVSVKLYGALSGDSDET